MRGDRAVDLVGRPAEALGGFVACAQRGVCQSQSIELTVAGSEHLRQRRGIRLRELARNALDLRPRLLEQIAARIAPVHLHGQVGIGELPEARFVFAAAWFVFAVAWFVFAGACRKHALDLRLHVVEAGGRVEERDYLGQVEVRGSTRGRHVHRHEDLLLRRRQSVHVREVVGNEIAHLGGRVVSHRSLLVVRLEARSRMGPVRIVRCYHVASPPRACSYYQRQLHIFLLSSCHECMRFVANL